MSAADPVLAATPAPAPALRAKRHGGYGRNLLGQGLARIVYMGASFAAFILIARFSNATVLGHYSLVLAILNMANTAADFGSNTLIAADLGRTFRGDERRYYGTFLALRLIAGWLTAPFLVAAAFVLDPATGPGMILIALALPLVGARFYDAVYQVYDRPIWTVGLTATYGAIILTGSWLALFSGDHATFWLIVVLGIAGIAYGGIGLVSTLTFLKPSFDELGPRLYALARRCLPIAASNFIGMLNGRIGILMLSAMASPAVVGVYNAGFRFFELGIAVAITVATPLIPILAKTADRDEMDRLLKRGVSSGLMLAVPVAVLAPLMAPQVVNLLYGAKYDGAASVAAFLAVAFAFNLVAMFLYSGLVAVDRAGTAVVTSLAGVAVNAAVALYAIPRLGADGAALSAVASEIVIFLINAALLTRAHGNVFTSRDVGLIAGLGLALGVVVLVTPTTLGLPVGLAALAAYGLAAVALGLAPNPLAARRLRHD